MSSAEIQKPAAGITVSNTSLLLTDRSEMTEMMRFPSHCYSVTGALCKHGF